MSEQINWIKVYRDIRKHWIWKDAEYLRAWLTIIMEVNYKEKKVLINSKLFICQRGQSLNSLETWSRLFGYWGKTKTRRFFNLLDKDDMIRHKSETVTTRLTVLNYDKYQGSRNADETQMKRERTADETEAIYKQEIKELKEEIRKLRNNNPPPTPQGGDVKPMKICPYQKIFDKYHHILPQLPRIDPKDPLLDKIKARVRGAWLKFGYDGLVEYFELVSRKPFLLGEMRGGWKADLYWLLRRCNMVKVRVSGSYGETGGGACKDCSGSKILKLYIVDDNRNEEEVGLSCGECANGELTIKKVSSLFGRTIWDGRVIVKKELWDKYLEKRKVVV
jgi:hypothetical protein